LNHELCLFLLFSANTPIIVKAKSNTLCPAGGSTILAVRDGALDLSLSPFLGDCTNPYVSPFSEVVTAQADMNGTTAPQP